MVELKLEPLDGALNRDFYVSVRVGEVQKLSRISAGRTYKFPANAVGDRKFGKIEIFKKVGGASVGIVPESGVDQEVCVAIDDESKVKFRVSLNGDSDKPASVPLRAAASEDKPAMREVNPKVQQAKQYLEQHNLEMRLSEAMQAVLREKPEDPAAFVAAKLAQSAGMVQKMPQSTPPTPAASVPAVKIGGLVPPSPAGDNFALKPSVGGIMPSPRAMAAKSAPVAEAPPQAAPAKAAPEAAPEVAPEAAPDAAPELNDRGEEKVTSVPVANRWECKASVGTWAAHKRGPKLIPGARG